MKRKLFALALALLLTLSGCAPAGEAAPAFRVTVLDVGQGLCVLVESEGARMLYDGGGRSSSSYVVGYLKDHGVKSLDYLVASHYDEDHISGLVGALRTCKVKTALTPDYRSDTKIYASFQSALSDSGAERMIPQVGDVFHLGGAEVQVLGPKRWDYEKENDRSIALRVTCGQVSLLLTGDAEFEAEAAMAASGLALQADVLVAGHHGSAGSSSALFLEAVAPKAVILSCGAGNAYGHPAESALARIRETGADLYRTDVQGEIVLTADGGKLEFSQEPCQDWTPGQGTAETPSGEITYVVNESSKRFHLPECPGVGQMKPENRRDTGEDREALIAQGYVPCGSCKP